MDNREFAKSLGIRTKAFAIAVIKFSKLIPDSMVSRIVKKAVFKIRN